MASLTIRDVPDDVLDRLRRVAAEQRRSVNAQAIQWLEDASRRQWNRGEWDDLLEDLRKGRRGLRSQRSDSAQLIRRMRDTR
jgi:plasmid stability protein